MFFFEYFPDGWYQFLSMVHFIEAFQIFDEKMNFDEWFKNCE